MVKDPLWQSVDVYDFSVPDVGSFSIHEEEFRPKISRHKPDCADDTCWDGALQGR